VKLYSATYACPHCGQTHLVAGVLSGLGMVIERGPDRAGAVLGLWPRGDYPMAVAEQIRAMTWCPAVGECVEMDDPERLRISPE
jgi:hypothetical protein